MTAEIYKALEKRLVNNVDGLAQVDWFANQYADSEEEDLVWQTPVVYLEFLPITWITTGDARVQEGLMTLRVHTVTDNDYEDKKRFTVTAHLETLKNVFIALHDFDCMLSYSPGNENILPAFDVMLINELTRVRSEPDHLLRRFVVTVEEYQAQVVDVSKYVASLESDAWVTATLDLQVDMKDKLTPQ